MIEFRQTIKRHHRVGDNGAHDIRQDIQWTFTIGLSVITLSIGVARWIGAGGPTQPQEAQFPAIIALAPAAAFFVFQ